MIYIYLYCTSYLSNTPMILKNLKTINFISPWEFIFNDSFLSITIVYNLQDTFKSSGKVRNTYLHGS